jgi:hypothetical protein
MGAYATDDRSWDHRKPTANSRLSIGLTRRIL